MFDIGVSDHLSFSVIRPKITGSWKINDFTVEIYYVENLAPVN